MKIDSSIAVAQITTYPAQIEANTQKIIRSIREARQKGASLVVFPELCVPGYGAMDLLYDPSYIEANQSAVETIAKETQEITAIVGFCDCNFSEMHTGGRPKLYNSAAVLHHGRCISVIDKTHLPNYEIFFEERYFCEPRNREPVVIGEQTIGIQICEDLWHDGYDIQPSKVLKEKGSTLIINISASPFHVGKWQDRRALLQRRTKEIGLPFIYANLVGCFDLFEGEVLFDGRSLVTRSDGTLIRELPSFQESLTLFKFTDAPQVPPNHETIAEVHDALVLGIREYFVRAASSGMTKAVVGVSGGIDSAVVLALAVEALGASNVCAVSLPTEFSSEGTKSDAREVASRCGVAIQEISIQEVYRQLSQQLAGTFAPVGAARENLQSRLRMMYLMYVANCVGGIVLNTGNKTELALDNCTIYGDMVGGFSVLGDIDKDRVYALASEINQRQGKELLPDSILKREPTAELKSDQFDSDVMGASPAVIAPLLRAIVEDGLSVEAACDRFKDVYSKELIERSFARLDRSEWKRRQAAPSLRVTPHAFGNGRRFPMSHGWWSRQ